MIDTSVILSKMTHGELPLAIGTSFGIESGCGILKDRDKDGNPIPTPPKKPPLNEVSELLINVRTIFRNIFNCIDNDYKEKLTPNIAVELVLNEMKMIPDIINQLMGNRIKVHFYVNSYKSLGKKFPHALIKAMNTDKQKMYWELEQHVAFYIINKPEINIEKYDVDITGKHPNTMIMTHLAVDLLSKSYFDKLLLLESHTGKVKPQNEWNTKLTNGKEHLNMPFNKFTIQVFGDGGNFISPIGIKLKRVIIELANQYHWTPITTKDKISHDIGTIRDHVERRFFQDLLKAW